MHFFRDGHFCFAECNQFLKKMDPSRVYPHQIGMEAVDYFLVTQGLARKGKTVVGPSRRPFLRGCHTLDSLEMLGNIRISLKCAQSCVLRCCTTVIFLVNFNAFLGCLGRA